MARCRSSNCWCSGERSYPPATVLNVIVFPLAVFSGRGVGRGLASLILPGDTPPQCTHILARLRAAVKVGCRFGTRKCVQLLDHAENLLRLLHHSDVLL